MRAFLTIAIALTLLLPVRVWAERGISIDGSQTHVALIIGNASYGAFSPLRNPHNDASDVGEALADLGFSVDVLLDANREAMMDALRSFRSRARAAEQAVIFYAGHGMEIDNRNYLLPVDAELESDLDIAFEALPLDLFTRAAEGASELSLVILDACRNNPFALQITRADPTRSISRGLAEVEPTQNTLIAFSAKAGTVAKDGAEGGNSPFAAAFLEALAEPQVEVGFFFRKVRDGVHRRTNGEQTPFVYGSLPAQEIFLNDGAGAQIAAMDAPLTIAPAPGTAQPRPQAATPDTTANESALDLAFWNSIKDSDRAQDFEAYLERFPNGTFAALARGRITPTPELEAKRELRDRPLQEAGLWWTTEIDPQTFADRNAVETTVADWAPRPENFERLKAALRPVPGEKADSLRHIERYKAYKRLQWGLTLTGYYAGAIDGLWGPQSRRAYSDWARERGISPRDRLTEYGVRVLELDGAMAGHRVLQREMSTNFLREFGRLPISPAVAWTWFDEAVKPPSFENLQRLGEEAGWSDQNKVPVLGLAMLSVFVDGLPESTRQSALQLLHDNQDRCGVSNVLGVAYANGVGVLQSIERAISYYDRALDKCGDTLSRYRRVFTWNRDLALGKR